MKIKTYKLCISRTFPKTHSRAGDETYFREQIFAARCGTHHSTICPCYEHPECQFKKHGIKLHTIRKNYPLWKHRIDEVNAGRAELVLYDWRGLPYHSKQRNLYRFDKGDRIGVQQLEAINRTELN